MSRSLKELFASNSLRNYFRNLLSGLRAPRDSGEHRRAIFQIQRVIIPGFSTMLFLASLIVMAVVFSKQGDHGIQDDLFSFKIMPVEPPIDIFKLDGDIQPDDKSSRSVTDIARPGTMDADITKPPTVDVDLDVKNVPAGFDENKNPGPIENRPVPTKSRVILPGIIAGRTGVERDAARIKYGDTPAGENAVRRSLRWLKTHQDDNGAWAKSDATHPPAMAGLALLAFLAHGETHDSKDFGATVEKTMRYLLFVQTPKGMFADGGNAYGHGIDTYAISEAYAMTKIVFLKEAMEKGLQVIIDGQQKTGGYTYGYGQGATFDLSVSGWQFQAMKAAKMAGAANPGLDAALAKSIDFLEKNAFASAGDNSGFVYSGKQGMPPSGGATPSMTGAGTLCLQLLGRNNSPCAAAGIRFLERVQPQWPAGKAPVYAWYYVTQAKFQKGGKVWDAWNRAFARELIANQKSDGHWADGDHGGDVYTTCLCTLMLEVYYRYLPGSLKREDKADTQEKDSDEAPIRISG